jgi:hypothetical protein
MDGRRALVSGVHGKGTGTHSCLWRNRSDREQMLPNAVICDEEKGGAAAKSTPIARRAHIHADGARVAHPTARHPLPARCREAAGSPYRPRRPSTVLRAPHQNKRTTTGWASLGDHTRSSIPRGAQRIGIMSHRAGVAGFEYVESERSFAPRPRRWYGKTKLKGLS